MCTSLSTAVRISLRKNLTPSYPGPVRYAVPDDKISWDVPWPEYNTKILRITSPRDARPSWADLDIGDREFKWNHPNDEGVNRHSYMGDYKIDGNGFPLNPIGRTGLGGRGTLGRWGCNHASDAIVVRKNEAGFDFVSIKRKKGGEWAIPGGMVDIGEAPLTAMIREFMEEAMDFKSNTPTKNEAIYNLVSKKFLSIAKLIFSGYVDDPRNTDNAWMETSCYLVLCDETLASDISQNLKAGDDASEVKWEKLSRDIKLYASHSQLINIAIDALNSMKS